MCTEAQAASSWVWSPQWKLLEKEPQAVPEGNTGRENQRAVVSCVCARARARALGRGAGRQRREELLSAQE